MIKELRKKKKKGFSLVELIVVIAIIGILAAIAVPKYSQYKEAANNKADLATAKLLAEATLMAVENGDITLKSVDATYDSSTNKADFDEIILYLSVTPAKKSNDSSASAPTVEILHDTKEIKATVGLKSHSVKF